MSKTRSMVAAALIAGASLTGAALSEEVARTKAQTIVLVHGAFADSSSWNGVIADLKKEGFPVIAVANPLRSLKGDADYISRVVKSISGPVILVGHSYGGEVISAEAPPNVKALVYVAGLAPETGESAASLGAQFPTGTLGETLALPILQADGSKDVYIDQAKFWKQFAADLPESEAAKMAVAQRPILQSALEEPAGPPAWKSIPSWFIFGSRDKNIPSALHAFMAKRAGAKEIVEMKGSSHVVMISHPHEVSAMIERAASASMTSEQAAE